MPSKNSNAHGYSSSKFQKSARGKMSGQRSRRGIQIGPNSPVHTVDLNKHVRGHNRGIKHECKIGRVYMKNSVVCVRERKRERE